MALARDGSPTPVDEILKHTMVDFSAHIHPGWRGFSVIDMNTTRAEGDIYTMSFRRPRLSVNGNEPVMEQTQTLLIAVKQFRV